MPDKPERPPIPPPRRPVLEFTTPVQTNAFYSEFVDRTSDAYQKVSPIPRGTLYSSILGGDEQVVAAYPNLYFLRETRYKESDTVVIWTWSTDPLAEDSYNAEISYFLEDVNTPVYTRIRTMRRDAYDLSTPTSRGTALTSLIGVKITNSGEGYTQATGTVGNATVTFVCGNGEILSGIVTKGGSGIANNAAITVTGDGGNGVATAIVQPATATLISEKKQEFPENHPLRNEYVQIVRVYRNPTGPVLQEQDYIQNLDVVIPKTRQELPSASTGIGTNFKDIRALDTVRSEVVTVDPSAIAAVLNAYNLAFPGTANVIDFPPILTSLRAVTSISSGDGSYSDSSNGFGEGTTFFHSSSASARAQGSASIAPDIIVETNRIWGRNVPITTYFFFMPIPVTRGQVLTKLQTLTGQPLVNDWPKFNPQSHTIIVTGGKVSVEAQARASGQFSSTSNGLSWASSTGQGSSVDVSSSIRHVTISDCIHDNITIDTSLFTSELSCNATATANGSVEILGVTLGGDITEPPSPSPSNVFATITPSSFSATTPAGVSALTGYYLVHSDGRPFGYNFAQFTAEVVNMADVLS